MITTTALDAATVAATHAELVTIYDGSAANPDGVVLCTLLDPLPVPGLSECLSLIGRGGGYLAVREDGDLIAFIQLSAANEVQGSWGAADPATFTRAYTDPGGCFDYCIAAFGRWKVDTRVIGSATRAYFDKYFDGTGLFDTAATDHPGLNGNPLTDYDDNYWTATVAADRTWSYEVTL